MKTKLLYLAPILIAAVAALTTVMPVSARTASAPHHCAPPSGR